MVLFEVQVPRGEPDARIANFLPLFPEHDVELIARHFPGDTLDGLVDRILNNPTQYKKRQQQPAPAVEVAAALTEPDYSDDSDLCRLPVARPLLVLDLISDLFRNHFYKTDLSIFVVISTLFYKDDDPSTLPREVHSCLCELFPNVDAKFFKKAFNHCRNMFSVLVASWIVSNGFGQKLKELINEPDDAMWSSMDLVPTEKQLPSNFDQVLKRYSIWFSFHTGFKDFKNIMSKLTKKYPQILDGTVLLSAASTVRTTPPTFTCLVCYLDVDMDRMITCSSRNKAVQHSYCRDCLRGHAQAAAEEMPLVAGAVGFKCMDSDCENPIYYSAVRYLISKDVRKRIDDRIVEENLALSGLKLERCVRCNYAVEMDISVDQNKVFSCRSCGFEKCRKCDRNWDEIHFGVSCKALDDKESGKADKERRQQLLNIQMSEVAIRKCHKCSLQFTKYTGCNKITCRCGATQCYVCKTVDIKYDHFCKHFKDPDATGCQQCNGCLLWEDASKKDAQDIQRIQQEFDGL